MGAMLSAQGLESIAGMARSYRREGRRAGYSMAEAAIL